MTADRQRRPLPRLTAPGISPAPTAATATIPRPERPALTARRHVDLARVSSAICSR